MRIVAEIKKERIHRSILTGRKEKERIGLKEEGRRLVSYSGRKKLWR